jgi:hypothetical protein
MDSYSFDEECTNNICDCSCKEESLQHESFDDRTFEYRSHMNKSQLVPSKYPGNITHMSQKSNYANERIDLNASPWPDYKTNYGNTK